MKMKKNNLGESRFVNAESAIAVNRDVQLQAIEEAAKKKRIAIAREMSDAVIVIEKWYIPRLEALGKKAEQKEKIKSYAGYSGPAMLTAEWSELQREKNRKLSAVEERYKSELDTNERWRESERKRIEQEYEELLASLAMGR